MEIRLHYCSRFTYEAQQMRVRGRHLWKDNGISTPLHPEDMVSAWVYFHRDNYSSELMTGLNDQSDIRLTLMQFSDLNQGYTETINHM